MSHFLIGFFVAIIAYDLGARAERRKLEREALRDARMRGELN